MAGGIGHGTELAAHGGVTGKAVIDGAKAVKPAFHQGFHDFVHVGVAVLTEGFLKTGQGSGDVAEMHLHQITACLKFPDIRQQIAKGRVFQPAADAQLYAQGMAAPGHFQRPAVIHGGADQAGNTAQRGNRGIVGVEGQTDAAFFTHGDDPLQEPGKIVPDLLLAVFPVIADGAPVDLVQIRIEGRAAPGVLPHAPPGAENAVGLPGHGNQRRTDISRQTHKVRKLRGGGLPAFPAENDVGVLLQGRTGKVRNFQMILLKTRHLPAHIGKCCLIRHDIQIQIRYTHFPDERQLLGRVSKARRHFYFYGHRDLLSFFRAPARYTRRIIVQW